MLFANLDRRSIGGGTLIRRGCLRSEHWALVEVGKIFLQVGEMQVF